MKLFLSKFFNYTDDAYLIGIYKNIQVIIGVAECGKEILTSSESCEMIWKVYFTEEKKKSGDLVLFLLMMWA